MAAWLLPLMLAADLQGQAAGGGGAPPANSPAETLQDINPYDRDLQLTAPLVFGRRLLGELPIVLTADDRVLIDSRSFLDLVGPLLNPVALANLNADIGDLGQFPTTGLAASGISLEYDPSTLSVAILKIEPDRLVEVRPFQSPPPEDEGSAGPNPFSAYVNLDVLTTLDEDGEVEPAGLVSGAARWGAVVFEAEAQAGGGLDGQTGVERRFARLVYDQPEAYRRWSLGDLTPEIRGRQGYVALGGIGVSRQRRRFNAFRDDILRGSRQLLLDQSSTVSVFRNGVLYQELQLDAGPYDLRDLPLLAGSNDVEIVVRDITGQTRSLTYSAYLDPIDLEPGDYEYAAYLGVVSDTLVGSPEYDGETAFTGYYRRAFLDRPALGVGLQASQSAQTVFGETQVVLGGGGRLQFNGSLSNSDRGAGYALGFSYDQVLDRGLSSDVFTAQVDYSSEDYATLGNVVAGNDIEWTANLQYSRVFSPRLFAAVNASYNTYRRDLDERWRVSASLNYRVRRSLTVSVGTDYGRTGFAGRDEEVGVRLALVWQPDFERRAEARYDTRRNSGGLSYARTGDGRVNSLNYGAFAGYDDGPANASAYVDFIGNRATGSLTYGTFGSDFGSLGEDNRLTASVGTAFAYTGGRFAMGRRVADSFAILSPHDNLGDRRVRVGDSLEDGRYLAASGPLGPALYGGLTPFYDQSIRYDIPDAPRGYDIGPGVVRVRPEYRSGFDFDLGRDDFVSAYGRVLSPEGEPLSLVSGAVASLTEPDRAAVTFFTNSGGRFAVTNLMPGHRYHVTINGERPLSFEFEAPADTDGLVDLATVTSRE